MDNFRNLLKNNRFFRTWVYRFRLLKERHSYCLGRGNKVMIKGVKVGSVVQISGSYNQVLVENGAVMKKVKFYICGNHNRIHIYSGVSLEKTVIHIEDNNCLIEVRENTYIGPSHLACTENGRSIVIGKDCMLSSNINVRTGDSHSIIDENGSRINPAESVLIGDHVWIGEGAKIMKGVQIMDSSIVASGSIVTHSFPSNVIIGGNPAKIIKSNVGWDKRR